MSRIKILPENLANQIAAGEVVERPASVVKELLENAIDAGASHIAIQVEGNGTRLIRVVDDGCGMVQDDILLSLERHATSKLTSVEQLASICTLGFRGEAIPSIASVSKISAISRVKGAELGSRVDVSFGKILKVHDMGCGVGTMIEVRDLFGNVPARRKFLKTATTELSHIDEVVRSYSLLNHTLGFSYQVNGRSILELPTGSDTLQQRVKNGLGLDSDVALIALDAGNAGGSDICVSGFLLSPDFGGGGKNAKLWVFVNGRVVKDRMLNHAVVEGLSGFLMKGRRAAGVLIVNLPPEAVDVNVHPTKQEVRFRQSNQVHKEVAAVVAAGMTSLQGDLQNEIFGVVPTAIPAAPVKPVEQEISSPSTIQPSGFNSSKQPVASTVDFSKKPGASLEPPAVSHESLLKSHSSSFSPRQDDRHSFANLESREPLPPVPVSEPDVDDAPSAAPEKRVLPSSVPEVSVSEVFQLPTLAGTLPQDEAPTLKYVGQILDTYIICESGDGMVAVDQHAAQERLIFEELKEQYNKQMMPSQVLMFPAMVELAPAEIRAMAKYDSEMEKLGLDIQEFGGESYVVKAVPASMDHLPPADIVRGILSQFTEIDSGQGEHGVRLESILADMACKASIKAGRRLKEAEARHLLAQMQSAGVFSHCPHGRPVLKHFSRRDIQKWFYRTS